MNFRRLTSPQRVSGIAMLVVILAAFLPWVSLFGLSEIGISGDGVITLVLALLGVATLTFTSGLIGAPRTPGRLAQVSMLVLAILTALVPLIDMNGAAAIGLYLTLFGSLAWVAGAIWHLTLPRQADSPVADQPQDQV